MGQMRHRRHVDDRLGTMAAKDVLGGSLANVETMKLDGIWGTRPWPPINADHLMVICEELVGNETPNFPRHARDQHPH